jgi:L-asparaginase
MRKLRSLFLLCGLLVSITLCAKPRIRIIATGGTIAGVSASSSSSAYTAGQVGIQALINASKHWLSGHERPSLAQTC